MVFLSKTNSADYHDEMNSEHLMEWFRYRLLPSIHDNSVIILDNATYHIKQKDKPPTSANRKDDIKKWLDKHNVNYNDKDIKNTLLDKARLHRPTPTYLKLNSKIDTQWFAFPLPIVSSILLSWHRHQSRNIYCKTQQTSTKSKRAPDEFEHKTPDMRRNSL